MQKKIKKIFFNLEIIAFEVAALNTRFYWERKLSAGINMSTNNLKIWDTTKREFLELISFHSDWKK